MTENDLKTFNEAVNLAQFGRKDLAHATLLQLSQTYPNDPNLLLWLIFTSSTVAEARQWLSRLAAVDPFNASLPNAQSWIAEEEARQQPPSSWPSVEPASYSGGYGSQAQAVLPDAPVQQATAEAVRQYKPLGEPVRDSTNFIMSQHGGTLLVWGTVFVGSSCFFLFRLWLLLFTRPRRDDVVSDVNTLMLMVYLFGSLFLAIVAAWFSYSAFMDLLTPPVKAEGYVSNRKQTRQDMRDRYGRVVDHNLEYELDFTPDDGSTGPVHLRLTEDQFSASGYSQYAYVIYSKRLGHVRLYQPLTY